jgi:hypothetical protein
MVTVIQNSAAQSENSCMSLFCRIHLFALLLFLQLVSMSTAGFGQTETTAQKIGYDRLLDEYGTSLPDGSDTVVALVEAFTGSGSGYLPDPDDFPGKTFNDQGEPRSGETAAVSVHSTGSANNFFGSESSAPGIDNIDVYSAGHWLGSGGLNTGSNQSVATQNYHVSNHSYVINQSDSFGTNEAAALLQRLDYYIDQNDSLVVAGSSNGNSTNLPLGLVPSFNVLSVGRSDGEHGAGPTTFYFEGRTKVDIVAPKDSTSAATPVVSSVAALLVDAADGNSDAIHVETLKATLLAGATKDEFADWDRTTSRPIDERYGAGEVNAYNSFKIQEGGQFEGTATLGGASVGDLGWDYSDSFESSPINPERYYRFEVGTDQYLNELSVALSWNIDINNVGFGRNPFVPVPDLANLDLELLDSDGNVVDASLSTVDNVEHIYLQDLAPGTYDLKLSGDRDSDFALAWRLNGSALPGDFNLDQQVDLADVDFYSGNLDQAAEGEQAILDLDLDGQITLADLELHVTTLVQTSSGGLGTTVGDTNLDGITDVLSDGFTLVNNLGSTDSVGYASGDFNADSVVDVLGDGFILVNGLPFQAAETSFQPSTSAIPEPGSGSILGIFLVLHAVARRRSWIS